MYVFDVCFRVFSFLVRFKNKIVIFFGIKSKCDYWTLFKCLAEPNKSFWNLELFPLNIFPLIFFLIFFLDSLSLILLNLWCPFSPITSVFTLSSGKRYVIITLLVSSSLYFFPLWAKRKPLLVISNALMRCSPLADTSVFVSLPGLASKQCTTHTYLLSHTCFCHPKQPCGLAVCFNVSVFSCRWFNVWFWTSQLKLV